MKFVFDATAAHCRRRRDPVKILELIKYGLSLKLKGCLTPLFLARHACVLYHKKKRRTYEYGAISSYSGIIVSSVLQNSGRLHCNISSRRSDMTNCVRRLCQKIKAAMRGFQ